MLPVSTNDEFDSILFEIGLQLLNIALNNSQTSLSPHNQTCDISCSPSNMLKAMLTARIKEFSKKMAQNGRKVQKLFINMLEANKTY